jgi:pyrimidine operon attenuation protein/uracil phosphoribosyltransferase
MKKSDSKKTQILDNDAIKQKTIRIAYQLVEDNYDEKEIYMIGVYPNGYEYARKLKKEIENIGSCSVKLLMLKINKQKPLETDIELELGKNTLDNKTVILVDDVANTGKTLYYALKPVMQYTPRKVQAAVLVDRLHKLFPVSADFVGLSLSTTMQEHISVEFDEAGKGAAYLT